MKRYNIFGYSNEHPNGEFVRYEDVAQIIELIKGLAGPNRQAFEITQRWDFLLGIIGLETVSAAPVKNPTFRDYVIGKFGSYPPCRGNGTPYDVTVQALADCFAEWVEM